MSDEERRTLERFVAGLDVDADALATAITGKALDATIVDEALLRTLADPEPVVRRRAARRITRMDRLAPEVEAAVRRLAALDADPETRAAAEAALAAHRTEPVERPATSTPRWSLQLKLAAIRTRSEDEPFAFEPLLHNEAPYADAILRAAGDAVALELAGLPDAFAGTRPSIVVDGDVLARATEPVAADGSVTIVFEPEAGTLHALWTRLGQFAVVV